MRIFLALPFCIVAVLMSMAGHVFVWIAKQSMALAHDIHGNQELEADNDNQL